MLLYQQLLTQVSCAQDVSDVLRVGGLSGGIMPKAVCPLLPGGFFMDKGRRA